MRTGDLTQEDLALQAKLLEHGILFPVEFKSKLRALILDSMRTLPMTHMEEGMLMRAAIIRPDGHEYGYQWGFNDADGPHATYQSCDPQRIATGIANGRYLVMLNIAEFSAAASGVCSWCVLMSVCTRAAASCSSSPTAASSAFKYEASTSSRPPIPHGSPPTSRCSD